MTLTIAAPAKINLFLSVCGRRQDGYHILDTLMAKLHLADTLSIGILDRPGIELACAGASIPDGEGNIAWRAAAALLAATGRQDIGVRIRIDKRIPVAAGLGGGSSDAAAVLLGLDHLLELGLGSRRLAELALDLGADVPFFVHPWPVARAGGIGERLAAATLDQPWHVVLVNPGFRVSTRWVFENFALTSPGDPYMLGRNQVGGPRDGVRPAPRHFRNDLERVTASRYPELQRIKAALLEGGAAAALMSGSGPTVFGLFADRDRAGRCCQHLAGQYPWAVQTTIRTGLGPYVERPAGPQARCGSAGVGM